jgi:MoaA/NifB/PqqE/SkfB family radical SAM enzyme
MSVLLKLACRFLTEVDPRLTWKFAYNFGLKGCLSVERFKSRLRRGIHFPPFLFLSIINSCQLRCQGCWVDVSAKRRMIDKDDLNKLIRDARKQGNSFFGILGGEPFMHPHLLEVLAAHPGCYFQIFTNGQLITPKIAKQLRRLGNATPLISIEGSEVVSDQRRGGREVFNKTLAGLRNCVQEGLIVGVATSVCQSNYELVSEDWLRRLIDLGVMYAWFTTYRVVGPKPTPELALTPEQVYQLRCFVVRMRRKLPIGLVDAYWDDQGVALCPMVTGISHHIGPGGDIEPCPIIQFARESIYDGKDLYQTLSQSAFLDDFRKTAARTTRGCIVLERPDVVRELVARHQARDTTQRGTALQELANLSPLGSQHVPGREVPEEHWLYRFAKKHWFFGFGAYS